MSTQELLQKMIAQAKQDAERQACKRHRAQFKEPRVHLNLARLQ